MRDNYNMLLTLQLALSLLDPKHFVHGEVSIKLQGLWQNGCNFGQVTPNVIWTHFFLSLSSIYIYIDFFFLFVGRIPLYLNVIGSFIQVSYRRGHNGGASNEPSTRPLSLSLSLSLYIYIYIYKFEQFHPKIV